jgi:hypothetical protein
MSIYPNIYTSDKYEKGQEHKYRTVGGIAFSSNGYMKNDYGDERKNREKIKRELQQWDYIHSQLKKIFLNDRALHLYSHYGITRINIHMNNCTLSQDLTAIPYKSNITCSLCASITPEQDKYTMVYEFLKKKIGPDCSRLVVYETLGMDAKASKDKDESNIISRYHNYFYNSKEMCEMRELYKSYDEHYQIYGTFATPKKDHFVQIN